MKSEWIIFWIGALATYRITIVIARDKIGKSLRQLPKVGTFFKCPFCVSVWVGWFVAVLLDLSGFYGGQFITILMGLAFSAITIFADRTFSSDYTT